MSEHLRSTAVLIVSLAVLLGVLLAACSGGQPRQVPSPRAAADDTLRMGLDAYERDEYRAALDLFRDSFTRYRSVDDVPGMLTALVNATEAALAISRHSDAARTLAESAHLLGFDGVTGSRPRLRFLEARLAARTGAHAEAADKLQALLEDPSTPDSLAAAARLLRARIAVDTAAEGAGTQVAAARRSLGELPAYAPALDRLEADLLAKRDRPDAAIALYARARDAYRERQDRLGLAATYEAWGRVLMARDEPGAARDRLDRALHIRVWLGDRPRSLALIEDLIEIARARGDQGRLEELSAWHEMLTDRGDPAWDRLRDLL